MLRQHTRSKTTIVGTLLKVCYADVTAHQAKRWWPFSHPFRRYPMSDGRFTPFALQVNFPMPATFAAVLMDRAIAPVFS
jgi:hypothetical protein